MKCLLKDKETMFWTLLFPLALGIFFNLAFSGIGKGETFQTIPVAVVDNEEYRNDTVFQTILQEVSSGEDPLFHLYVVSEQVASKMLEDNQISGYFVAGSPVTMVVKTTGMRQSIIRSFLDTYIQNMSLVSTVMQKNPKALKALTDDLFHTVSYLKEVSATDAKPDNVASYYYVLIAMACFYGFVRNIQAAEVIDVFINGQLVVYRYVLHDDADLALDVVSIRCHGLSENLNVALFIFQQGQYAIDGRGFPGAVRT
jgi:ABC-2 type transport system permease protein